MTGCRIQIVNDVTDKVTWVETKRPFQQVYFDLARIVRRMNRRPDQTFWASLNLYDDHIVIHFHTPHYYAKPFAVESLAVAEPLRQRSST